MITLDQGRELTSEFGKLAERHDTDCPDSATFEAPWQNGMCERHGAVLASVAEDSVEQLNIEAGQRLSVGPYLHGSQVYYCRLAATT
eukprot:13072696-Heterocapsa_arctica.AAC.1